MRVTTQMLNNSARKAGLPVNNTSLLNYVNGSGGNNNNSVLEALRSKTAEKVTPVDKVKYEKLKKTADAFGRQADKFTETGEKSLFEKAKASGDYTAVYQETENLAEKYNSLLSALESDPGTMNDFYRRSLQELVSENKEALSGIGVTLDKRGKLQVDREKLEAADRETVEKVLGKEGNFTSKLAFLAGRVEDNADTNLSSSSRGYSAKGDITAAYANRYDRRG